MKTINFSEVNELDQEDSFYRDVLSDTKINKCFNLKAPMDLFFYESISHDQNQLNLRVDNKNGFHKTAYRLKVLKHYTITGLNAIPVSMGNCIYLTRPKPGNNIYLPICTENLRRVFLGFKIGPRAGQGFELIFTQQNGKWKIKSHKRIWIS
jgi:hypothetical protein